MSNGIDFNYASEETFKITATLDLRSLDLLIEALKPRTEEDRYARRAVEDLEAVRKRALSRPRRCSGSGSSSWTSKPTGAASVAPPSTKETHHVQRRTPPPQR